MTVLTVLHYPDIRLKTKAEPVTDITPAIKTLVEDMFETMYHDNGIGLAATQVNVHLRVIVMDIAQDNKQKYHFINPEILEAHGTEVSEEGCLSVPGVYDKVSRSARIKVKALNIDNQEFILEAEGLLAVCIQHEIDHINGKLFIDHLSLLKRERALKKMEKLKYRTL